jgi:pyrroline-5-carboxylate reductase
MAMQHLSPNAEIDASQKELLDEFKAVTGSTKAFVMREALADWLRLKRLPRLQAYRASDMRRGQAK